ncbi:type 1 glutamine amidotransferase [Sphingomonas lenta]|uniref:Glutamine amidotransferase n=1 Tax=Sphingomonas lenta TaxID=1141887 RepID=A0A2A2SEZ9_9SPHN|nr:gamma-glutamyl-gamma-aminobutyrate hydrolase family protein [Sphingomonas lenta]PAX07818.1 glutamine amidotransferase [Sphingomonas lenta]
MRFLVAESEPPDARERRRANVGRSSGETFRDLLLQLAPGAEVERATPADADDEIPDRETLAGYDAVFLTGSPLHVYEDTPEARREIEFMRRVFASGTPSFGSCAGLQVAAAAAGGVVRSMGKRREAGITRRITPTDQGRAHPLLAGRAPAWDAITIHNDEVERLPDGALLLARNNETEVQAAEIRMGPGVFWGVQYHPELPLSDMAAALRRDADDLVEAGLVRDRAEVELQSALLDALAREPDRRDLRWRLGVDDELANRDRRSLELRNFIEHLVKPTMAGRGR